MGGVFVEATFGGVIRGVAYRETGEEVIRCYRFRVFLPTNQKELYLCQLKPDGNLVEMDAKVRVLL